MQTLVKMFPFLLAMYLGMGSLCASTDTTLTATLCFPDANSQMNNVILSNLAPSLPKENNNACLKYKVNIASEIGQTTVKVFYRNAKVEHTVQFQNFSLRDLMFPVNVTIELQFMTGSVLLEKKDVQFQMEQSGLFSTYSLPSGKTVTNVISKIKKIELGQAMLDRLVTRQQVISDYYTADVQIKLAEEELKKINLNNLDNNEQYQDITRKVLATVERIRAKKFEEKLFLNENDPVRLLPRLAALYNQAHGSKNQLTRQTANIGEELYRLGVIALQKKDTTTATQMFNQAIEVEPKFAMPYVKLASIEASKRNLIKTIEQIRFVDKNTKHDSAARNESNLLINNIITEIVEDARLSRQQQNFNEAILQIDSCYTICQSISFLTCSNIIDIERNAIYTAILERFINNNAKILEAKVYAVFLSKTDSLYRYQILYQNYFNNRGLVFEHLNKSYNILVNSGEENISGNPSGALDALMTSKQLCEKYTEVSCNPRVNDLISSVFGKLYESMVDEAMLLFNAQNLVGADSLQQKAYGYCQQQNLSISEKHIQLIKLLQQQRYNTIIDNLEANRYKGCQALSMADSAIGIRKTYNFNGASNEISVLKTAAGKCIAQSLVDAEKSLISKNFSQVVVFLHKAETLAKTHGIELDQPTVARIAEIRGLLEQGICGEIKFSIDVQLNAADIHLRNVQYPFATEALKKAENIVKSNANCGFTSDEIEHKIKFLKFPSEFQLTWDNIIELIQKHNFNAAAIQILKIEQDFPDSLLAPHNLKAKPILTFTKEYDYTPFTLGAIEYLAEHGKTEMALDLLYFLYDKEVPEHLTDKAQDKMGRSLAKRDVAKQKDGKPKDIVYQYIRHDEKWFKKMVKSYNSQWKKSIAS